MSIFDFVKDAGKKLLSGAAQQASGGTQAGELLQKALQQLDLGIQSPQIKVEGDKAIIEGNAPNQAAMEKAILAVGNHVGIAQVESRIQTPQPAAEPHFYTVKSGDTLSKIAKEVYGNANRYNEIFEANRPMLKTADEIFPGQQLRIPEDTAKAA